MVTAVKERETSAQVEVAEQDKSGYELFSSVEGYLQEVLENADTGVVDLDGIDDLEVIDGWFRPTRTNSCTQSDPRCC